MAENTISRDDAIERIEAWKQHQASIIAGLSAPELGYSPPLTINAFTFKLDEIFNLCMRIYNYHNPDGPVTMPKLAPGNYINAIRFYAGIKEEGSGISEYGCLVAVPVEEADLERGIGGKDLLWLSDGDHGEMASAIYDFSFPCPSTCAQQGNGIIPDVKKHKALKDL